jgi:hypothetical protein
MKIMYLLVAALVLGACVRFSDLDPTAVKGSGTKATETRTLSQFSKVELEGAMDVFVSQGTNESVRIEADDNILKLITTEIKNGELELSTSESISPVTPIKVWVTTRSLEGLSIAGSGTIVTETPVTAEKFATSIAGSGDIHANVNAQTVDASIAGSGDVVLTGTAKLTSVSVAGSGDVRAIDLATQTATVDIAGSGNCEIDATEQITGNIMGSGSIYYKGEPKVSRSIMGSGDIRKK